METEGFGPAVSLALGSGCRRTQTSSSLQWDAGACILSELRSLGVASFSVSIPFLIRVEVLRVPWLLCVGSRVWP